MFIGLSLYCFSCRWRPRMAARNIQFLLASFVWTITSSAKRLMHSTLLLLLLLLLRASSRLFVASGGYQSVKALMCISPSHQKTQTIPSTSLESTSIRFRNTFLHSLDGRLSDWWKRDKMEQKDGKNGWMVRCHCLPVVLPPFWSSVLGSKVNGVRRTTRWTQNNWREKRRQL